MFYVSGLMIMSVVGLSIVFRSLLLPLQLISRVTTTTGVAIPDSKTPLSLLIAKTVSEKDVKETMQDISLIADIEDYNDLTSSSPTATTRTSWKLFCYQEATFKALRQSLENHPQRKEVEIIYQPNKMKIYFWENFLKDVSQDYLWLMDGDISLQNMNWSCFWNLVSRYDPAIFQPAIVFESPHEEEKKAKGLGVHYSKCDTDADADSILPSLAGVETRMIEIQLPLFRSDVWMAVRSSFDEHLGSWGNFSTDWGLDSVWCGLADEIRSSGRTMINPILQKHGQNWKHMRDHCEMNRTHVLASSPVGHAHQIIQERPPTCMVIQATPVKHMDTKSVRDFTYRREFRNAGAQDKLRYQQAFPSYFVTGARMQYFRSFFMDQPCQKCRKFHCNDLSTVSALSSTFKNLS